MEQNIYKFNLDWKNILLLSFLAIFPNVFGLFNVEFYGFRVHFFQYFIFLAALVYGPWGGLISGLFGSIYTAFNLSNPYIIIGNIILGFFVGFFAKKYNMNTILAVILAFSIQLPWLYATDVYLAGMSILIVRNIIIALTLSNLFWALIADLSYKRLKI